VYEYLEWSTEATIEKPDRETVLNVMVITLLSVWMQVYSAADAVKKTSAVRCKSLPVKELSHLSGHICTKT